MLETEIAQPAIFAMQLAFVALWKSIGVVPSAVVGHSVGEIAAACVAGILSLAEGARIIVLRASMMHQCARGEGTMLAVSLSEQEALDVIARHDRSVSIAAFNGPRSLTLAGIASSLEAIQGELAAQNIFARFVKVPHPYHHAMMQPAADQLIQGLADIAPQAETLAFFSTVTGERCAGQHCDAAHWGRGIRQPVQFVKAVDAMADFGVDIWLEISPHPALSLSIQECLSARGLKTQVTATARREREHDGFLEAALALHRGGVLLDFTGLTPSRELLSLPAYPWEKSRWWHESSELREARLTHGGKGLLDARQPRATPTWTTRLDNRHLAFLKDHKVDTHVIFPAAAFVEIALEVGLQLFDGRPFALEDFEIRRPLILPDPASALTLELTYEPTERSFTIQSRFEQTNTWSVHVVGSMRSERTESSFANSIVGPLDADLAAEDVGAFYDHMSELGLRYGDEFRPIRELAAGAGKSAGRVALSEIIAARAEEYALHPVLLDGALQVFSAGAKTVEDRRAKMKLPVRFARILFLRSPGASTQIRSKVLHYNDELIEGRIGIYDEAGHPCVLVDGFRAISMSATRRPGTSGDSRDLVYHVDWERKAPTSAPAVQIPLSLARLRDVATAALNEVIDLRGREQLEGVMAAEDHLAAAQLAKGLREMGVGPGFSAASLGVTPLMRTVFGRLMAKLVKRGLLTKNGGTYAPTAEFGSAADTASDLLRAFITEHPGHLPEALLCASSCGELAAILRGEKDAVQILFGGANAELLDHFYGDGLFSSHWMISIAKAVQAAARQLPEGRGLRILEVGAGTAGLAAQLLPLLERGLHSYTFTDVSAGFFSAANQKLAAFPEVEYKVLDLEKPAAEQEFEPGTYDFIVGTNVLHAVADVRVTLAMLHDLLVAGGTLMFMDLATPQLWTESVFGLTQGWWHLTDRDLRPEQPLMQRAQWEFALKDAGFDETTSMPGLLGPEGEGQIGILGRKTDQVLAAADAPLETVGLALSNVAAAATPLEACWVVFADEGGLGSEVAAQVVAGGARCRMVRRGERFARVGADSFTLRDEEPDDWKELLAALLEDTPPERFVYLWTLDEKIGTGDHDALMGTDALLHLTHALEATLAAAKLRFDLITRGAQPAGSNMGSTNVAQAPALGMFRVILSEHPNFSCRGIDLPSGASAADCHLLWNELMHADNEREVALRGEARYVQRISHGLPQRMQHLDSSVPLRLESRERGLLDSLHFTPFTLPLCGPDDVLIHVKAAGMNFRDVLKALALYPAETADARVFGDEVAGEVLAIGADISHLAVGDKVFGLAVFGLATTRWRVAPTCAKCQTISPMRKLRRCRSCS